MHSHWKKEAMRRVTNLILAKPLDVLSSICAKQKTISTERLECELELVAENMKRDGIFIRDLAKEINGEKGNEKT